MKKHQWDETRIDEFHCDVCNQCGFVVLATLAMPGIEKGKSYYYPTWNLIIWGGKDLSDARSDKLCEKHQASCSGKAYPA